MTGGLWADDGHNWPWADQWLERNATRTPPAPSNETEAWADELLTADIAERGAR